jgi:hypothetical protein
VGRKIEASSGRQETKPYVSGCSEENSRGSAGTLGKMEEEQTEQVNGKKPADSI